MKKFALVLVIMLSWSCSVDEGPENDFSFEIVPILSVELPDTLVPDQMNSISYTYKLQTTCHSFNDLYYVENGNERTLAVVNLVTTQNAIGDACEDLINSIDEREVDVFVPAGFESVVFNFWQGEDTSGEDIYLTLEVPVEVE